MTAAGGEYAKQLDAALQFLKSRTDYLVLTHVNPDGDAIGSALAMGRILRRLGRTGRVAIDGGVPEKFRYLADSPEVADAVSSVPERPAATVVTVDCADAGRIGGFAQWAADNAEILNIDHHPTNDRFGASALIRDDAASTTEVLVDLLEHAGIEPEPELALCLYTGLLTDTGGFRYANTTPNVMRIASDLLARGVDGPRLAERLLERMTLGQVQLLRRALGGLGFAADNRIAWMTVSLQDMAETSANREDSDGLVNYALNIEGVEVGLLFKEAEDGGVKVSFRSAGLVDVAGVAQIFGGGGHVRASGCLIRSGKNLAETAAMVVERVRRELP